MPMGPALPDGLRRLPIAHRALHDRAQGRVENSPGAIRAAIAAGYAIEVDVQLSRDGVAMVFHDDDLDRLTGATGPVSGKSAAELGQIRLTDSAETIPTLAAVLGMIGGAVPLLIELKDQTLAMAPSDGRLEAAVAADLRGYAGAVAVMSFNPHMIYHMARLAPDVPRGLTTSAYDVADWHPLPEARCNELRDIPDFDATGASFISHEAADLTRPRVAALKAAGAVVLCWTITSPEAEAQARKVAAQVTFEQYLPPLAP